jgi:hypothetical protein
VALSSDLSSRTAAPGDPFAGRLVSDLVIDGHRVAPAGARVSGTVREVVSGSNTIGAVPLLALQFQQLELNDGQQIAINGEFTQQGDSEKGQDAAKIAGGAAVGALIGRKVSKKKSTGTILGGLLGGGAGAVIAKKTGTEVQLADGSTMTFTLGEGFKVASN